MVRSRVGVQGQFEGFRAMPKSRDAHKVRSFLQLSNNHGHHFDCYVLS